MAVVVRAGVVVAGATVVSTTEGGAQLSVAHEGAAAISAADAVLPVASEKKVVFNKKNLVIKQNRNNFKLKIAYAVRLLELQLLQKQ